MRMFLIIALAGLIALPVLARPTGAQMNWFKTLSPAEAEVVMRAHDAHLRMQRWKEVTRVAVVDLVRTSKVAGKAPVDRLDWSADQGETVRVWMAIETPKKTRTPLTVQIRWELDGELQRLETLNIERPSPYYRFWDYNRVNQTGTWTIKIVTGNRVLKRKTFTVS